MKNILGLAGIGSRGGSLFAAVRRRLYSKSECSARSRVQSGEELPGSFFRVGNHSILLPPEHALRRYRDKWLLYDVPLSVILRSVQLLDRDVSLIDIGANIGDTAAIANYSSSVPVLCVEGDPLYLPYLRRNGRELGPHLVIAECFVSNKETCIDSSKLARRQGTTSAKSAIESGGVGATPVRRLDDILRSFPQFADASVLKTDTDGHDFAILAGHKEYLAERQPVIYLEYMVANAVDAVDAKDCLRTLFDVGYRHFVVFDNFGNLVRTCHPDRKRIDILADELNAYLISHRLFGTAIYYFDVCAYTGRHQSLDELIAARYAEYIAAGRVLDRREQ